MKRGFLHFFTKGDEEKEQIIRKVLVGSMKVAAGFGLGMATARTITRYK